MNNKMKNLERRMIIASNIRQYVEIKEYDYASLSNILGVTQLQMYKYANGILEPPSIFIYNLCKELGIDVYRMFCTKEEWNKYINHTK